MKVSKDWPPFEARLVEALPALEEEDYLILSHPETHHFLQFAAQGHSGLRAEAKSNSYIPPARQLGPEPERRLIELGWKAPTHRPGAEDSDPDGSPNWFQEWELPVPWATVAQVAGLTLREVYRVRYPSALRYHAFHSDGTRILLPTLKLRPEARKQPDGPVWPEFPSDLRQAVDRATQPLIDRYSITRLENGDLLTTASSGAVAVGERADPFRILLYTRLLESQSWSPDLLAAVNELNRTLMTGRVYREDDLVMMDHPVPAEPFLAEQFTRELEMFHALAPLVAAELRQALGGTILSDRPGPE
jgi:hypothetical protein